jgi:hypothetical protein
MAARETVDVRSHFVAVRFGQSVMAFPVPITRYNGWRRRLYV